MSKCFVQNTLNRVHIYMCILYGFFALPYANACIFISYSYTHSAISSELVIVTATWLCRTHYIATPFAHIRVYYFVFHFVLLLCWQHSRLPSCLYMCGCVRVLVQWFGCIHVKHKRRAVHFVSILSLLFEVRTHAHTHARLQMKLRFSFYYAIYVFVFYFV